MTKHLRRLSVRPTLETLEDRCTPAGTVTGSLTNGVWRLTGDDDANLIQVTSSGSPGAFTVAGYNATSVAGVLNPKSVHRIVFDMKGGSDVVDLNVARLASMAFLGGDGGNSFVAARFSLTKGLQIVNGVGADGASLANFKIGGNIDVNNGNGGSSTITETLSAAAGFNYVAGNINVTNGAGADLTSISDTNVVGSITVHNGAGDGVNAGRFMIANDRQTGSRAVNGGGILVTYQDGKMDPSGVFDAVVRGNVLFNFGSASANMFFDGSATNLRTIIQGRLKLVGTGTITVGVGQNTRKTGLRIGQNLVIDVVNPTDLTLRAYNLIVQGQTKIAQSRHGERVFLESSPVSRQTPLVNEPVMVPGRRAAFRLRTANTLCAWVLLEVR